MLLSSAGALSILGIDWDLGVVKRPLHNPGIRNCVHISCAKTRISFREGYNAWFWCVGLSILLTQLFNMTNLQIILQTPLFWICNRSYITVYFSAAWRITVPSLLQEAQEKLTDAMECNSVCVCMTMCTSYLEKSDFLPTWWKNFGVQIAKEAGNDGNCKLFLSFFFLIFLFGLSDSVRNPVNASTFCINSTCRTQVQYHAEYCCL